MDSYLTPTHKNQSLLVKELSTKKQKQKTIKFTKGFYLKNITLGYERVFIQDNKKCKSYEKILIS